MAHHRLFLVQRLARNGNDDGLPVPLLHLGWSWQGVRGADDEVGQRAVPVALFATNREAVAAARRLEREARAGLSPFWLAEDFADLTTLSVRKFTHRLMRLKLAVPRVPPAVPDDASEVWDALVAWWDEHAPAWDDDQWHAVWGLFDRVRFYGVTKIGLED